MHFDIRIKYSEDRLLMTTIETVFGVILLLCAVFLVIAVIMQQGKQKGLSGSIAGGADTFFGKEKGKTIDKVLSKATTVIAIIFVVLVVVLFITDAKFTGEQADDGLGEESVVTTVAETAEETAGETAGETTADVAETTPVDTTAEVADTTVAETAAEVADTAAVETTVAVTSAVAE